MNEPAHDEQLLIDYALGQCPPAEAEAIRQRLETDEAFAALHANLSNAFGALEAYTVADPPEDLVRRTLERVRAQRRTEALVEAQPIERRVRVPMFSFRELGAVAAVLLLALGVLLPSLYKARGDANRVLCADNIRMIATGMFHYANGNNHALPAAPSKVDVWLRNAGQACASNSAALFLLVRKNYAPPGI